MILTCAMSVWLTKQKYLYDISNQPLCKVFSQSFLSYIDRVTYDEYKQVEWLLLFLEYINIKVATK